MRIFIIILGIGLITSWSAHAQRHLNPPHGGNGAPGPFPHSFVIEWEEVPGALRYEYVLSDNPQCFSGCPGDTRAGIVTTTSAVEYNLQEDTWYYWITRVHFSETDASVWTNISSFLADSPEIATHIADVAPNPVAGEISVHVDWGVNPAAQFVLFTLYDLLGRRISGPLRLDKSSPRFEVFRIPTEALPAGVYVARFVAHGNLDNRNNRRSQTIVVY